ncbi:hypothetical protein B0H15DRAFT_1016937 [Mycena belliarum]|uniref:RNA polymerase II-associated protein 3 n=1 Tax=Mycena belliarum TaxID=1033014 RepID=A0AAD6UH15_9AGAR|nr:hypothetical protein B0H15DRAFT_1016937 [Mycena belliae]
MAQAAKEKGNAAFKAGDYPTAVGHYSAAMHADRTDATFPLNRAAAYLKLGKSEDAERDCSTVLALSKVNVKALFRRAQARVGMGKLAEAQKDLTEAAKLEPANQSVKAELSIVAELMQRAAAKKSKVVPADVASTSTPKRRRVPITIVEPDGRRITPAQASTASVPSGSKATPTPITMAKTSTDTIMNPISSRPLTAPSTSNSKAHLPAPSPAPPQTQAQPQTQTQPQPDPQPKPKPAPAPAPASFKDAKSARDTSKPSRVGGGIFRASGENTIFAPRERTYVLAAAAPAFVPNPPPPAPASESIPPAPAPVQTHRRPAPAFVPAKSPMTLVAFTRAWDADPAPGARRALLFKIPPGALPALFQTSLEPALLAEAADALAAGLALATGDASTAGDSGDARADKEAKEAAAAYLHAFARVPRFATVVRLLSTAERARVRGVWGVLGVGVVRADGAEGVEGAGAWAPVFR